jgi:hypothetical protein
MDVIRPSVRESGWFRRRRRRASRCRVPRVCFGHMDGWMDGCEDGFGFGWMRVRSRAPPVRFGLRTNRQRHALRVELVRGEVFVSRIVVVCFWFTLARMEMDVDSARA